MIGNSLRSDVLPALRGGRSSAAWIPYPLTWSREVADPPPVGDPRYAELASIVEAPAWLEGRDAP